MNKYNISLIGSIVSLILMHFGFNNYPVLLLVTPFISIFSFVMGIWSVKEKRNIKTILTLMLSIIPFLLSMGLVALMILLAGI